MTSSLLKLLKLRKNEGKKIFLFFLFALFLQSGVSIAESVSSSLFLVNVGFEKLPIIYILTPIVMILIYLPIYSNYIKRYTEERFFKVSLISLTFANIGIVLAIKFAKPYLPPYLFDLLFYFVMLYTIVWATALYTLFWNFIDNFFDILDSKRVFSIFSAGTAVGAIIGGSLVSILTKIMPAVDLFLLWSLFALLTLVTLISINKKYKKIALQEEEDDSDNSGIVQQMLFMFTTAKKSPYVLYISAVFFLSLVLATTLEYEYMSILSKDQTEESLAALFGKLFVFVNVFNLIVNFFLFNRMVLNYGVRNMALIQPMVFIAAFAYLSISMEFAAAIFGFFVVQGLLVSIDNNNQNLLYNGIRSNIKYRVRTFIENLGEPLAMAFSGLLLLLLNNRMSPTQIAYIGAFLAFVSLIIVLFLRSEYPKSMVKNLKANWLDFSQKSKHLLSNLNNDEMRELNLYTQENNNRELALDILSQHKPLETLMILLPYLNTASNEVFENNRALLKELLQHTNPQIPRFIMEWIEENIFHLSLNLMRELGMHGFISSKKIVPMFNSLDPKRRATSAIIILNSHYPDDLSRASEIIHSLIYDDKIENISEGIFALGESKHSEYAFFISKFLRHSDDKIRIQALRALYTLANTNLSRLIPEILSIFKEASAQEREISIEILKKIKDSQCIIPMLKESDILTPYERRNIILLIKDFGLQTVPSIVTVLVEDRFSYSARSIAARTLGSLAFAQFKSLEEELIRNEIQRAYKYLHKHFMIEKSLNKDSHKRLQLLSAFYKDIHKNVLEFILELLTIGGRLPDFEMIKTAINSDNAKSRGNAIETIEQSTDKNIFALLLPLIDGQGINESMNFYLKNFKGEEINTAIILEEAIKSKNSLEQSIVLEILYHTSDKYKNIFREVLNANPSGSVKRFILFLLDNAVEKTNVFKLNLLFEHSFFNAFNLFELSLLLENSCIVEFKKEEGLFKKGLDNVYIQLADTLSHLTQEVIGLDDLLRKEISAGHLFSETSKYLELKNESILQSIHTYPTMGVTFAQKMSSYENE